MKTETNNKNSFTYSNQFLRMIQKSTSADQFQKIEQQYGPFEMDSYHPNQRIDITNLSSILESLSEDNNIGLKIGQSLEIGQFGSASYYILSCSTLFEVFRFYARFYELFFSSKETVTINLTKNFLEIKINAPFTKLPGDFLRYEMLVSTLVSALRICAGSDCIPETIAMPMADEADAVRIQKILKSDIIHSEETITLRYGQRWLGQRLPNENAAMRQVLRLDTETQLQQLRSRHSIVEQINMFLERQTDFVNVTQITVASAFNVSESTFKRRLQDEDTNFKSIMQSFKQTRSLHLLTSERNKFDSIAIELGFSERASFERAFKGWYGMTPAQFREIAKLCEITGPIEQILNSETLPASPAICQRIIELTSQPEFDIKDLTKAIGTDPVLTGKIIGLSNSAIYGGISKVSNLQQAIVKLGVNQVKNIAMGILASEAAGGKETLPIDMKRYWSSALTTAYWARELGSLQPNLKQNSETLFLTGLLHNIGFVLLASLRPESMLQLIPRLANHPTLKDKAELETQVFGVSRYSASAILLAHWGLPVDLITVIHGIIQVIEGHNNKHLSSHLVYQIVRYQVSSHTKDSEQEELDGFILHLARVINVDQEAIRICVAKLNDNKPEIESLAAMLISN